MSKKQLIIDPKTCTGCGACLTGCPFNALSLHNDIAQADVACVFCGACVDVCPVGAIRLQESATVHADLSDWSGVWVFAEQIGGVIQPVTLELIGEGRRLAAARGATLHVICLGYGLDTEAKRLLNYGVDSVLLIDDPALQDYAAEPYARILADLMQQRKPEIVLAGATAIGRAFLGRAAVLAETGLTADCTALSITDAGMLLQTRPAFGGNVMASILCQDHRPQMATVRHKVFPEAAVVTPHGTIERIAPKQAWLQNRTMRTAFVAEPGGTALLHEADIIVSGGRGAGGAKGFALIEQLAQALGGAVAASRSAVDAGWCAYSHQVGQTGKTVAPRLYIACGISGAVQHQVGMGGADRIVAINADPDAPIFGIADYGIVGDLFEILPALITQAEARDLACKR